MSGLLLFYDTETTGLPVWTEPSESEVQPHIVELGALVVCTASHEIVHSLSLIIRPDGWEIPAEVTDVHGITTERARQVGVPEAFAVETFWRLHAAVGLRVAYNEQFDARILRIALKRFGSEELAEQFKAAPAACAMRRTQKVLGGRNPKLADAYQQIVGEPMAGAHSAYGDCLATAKLWRHLPEPVADAT